MMEKIGVQTVEVSDGKLVKTASSPKKIGSCEHPPAAIQKDGDVRFCNKCQKYLLSIPEGGRLW